MIAVIDASAAVDALVGGQRANQVRRTLADCDLYAPAIIDLEVTSALARLERAGEISPDLARAAIDIWLDGPVTRVAPTDLAAAAFARRAYLRVADAFYVALAQALPAPLITTDQRLARAPLAGITVIAVS
ncbi:MAG: type II toxin-antitoxin system VapC family toxin [Bifidobacteriaceae bacterium]|jgi:predicted nucleic acid-binding protein|nr:type II toxin-antitoxin system VapC family toxin [Bifidobacteriaceae bacterium]